MNSLEVNEFRQLSAGEAEDWLAALHLDGEPVGEYLGVDEFQAAKRVDRDIPQNQVAHRGLGQSPNDAGLHGSSGMQIFNHNIVEVRSKPRDGMGCVRVRRVRIWIILVNDDRDFDVPHR